MAKYANQKKLKVNKEAVNYKQTKRIYFAVYWDTLEEALSNLTFSGVKLYLYLVKNQNSYSFDFSPQDVSNKLNMSVKSVHNAIKELKEKGYLIEEDSGDYSFFDSPIEIKQEPKVQPVIKYEPIKEIIIERKVVSEPIVEASRPAPIIEQKLEEELAEDKMYSKYKKLVSIINKSVSKSLNVPHYGFDSQGNPVLISLDDYIKANSSNIFVRGKVEVLDKLNSYGLYEENDLNLINAYWNSLTEGDKKIICDWANAPYMEV